MLLFPQLEQVKHCNAFGGIAVVVATSVMIWLLQKFVTQQDVPGGQEFISWQPLLNCWTPLIVVIFAYLYEHLNKIKWIYWEYILVLKNTEQEYPGTAGQAVMEPALLNPQLVQEKHCSAWKGATVVVVLPATVVVVVTRLLHKLFMQQYVSLMPALKLRFANSGQMLPPLRVQPLLIVSTPLTTIEDAYFMHLYFKTIKLLFLNTI